MSGGAHPEHLSAPLLPGLAAASAGLGAHGGPAGAPAAGREADAAGGLGRPGPGRRQEHSTCCPLPAFTQGIRLPSKMLKMKCHCLCPSPRSRLPCCTRFPCPALQALWYYVQPPMLALRLVASLAAEASAGRLRGAALLDLLHSRCAAVMGDAHAHKLALRLLRCAAAGSCGPSLALPGSSSTWGWPGRQLHADPSMPEECRKLAPPAALALLAARPLHPRSSSNIPKHAFNAPFLDYLCLLPPASKNACTPPTLCAQGPLRSECD